LQRDNSSSKIDTLQREVASLRGQVEELTHQLEIAQKAQRAMYSDLDKRVGSEKKPAVEAQPEVAKNEPSAAPLGEAIAAKANSAKTVPASAQPSSASAPKIVARAPNSAEEQQIYQTAYDLIKSKKYTEAVSALQKMLQRYPEGQSAANAHYWLGELYGLLNKNEQSASEFALVVKNYPDSPKVSDAELKLGFMYLAQFKWDEAKATFKSVTAHYPGTASARSAAEQLKQIKKAGH
jgi:tol-pal system protein YbgF